MSYSNLTNAGNYQLAQFGQKGFRVLENVAATSVANEVYNVIYIVEDCTLTATTAVAGDSIASLEVVGGQQIVGRFSSVSIAGSGSVICYIA